MTDRPAERYDALPYESQPVPYASPASLALAARWHGGPRATLERARVLELGCGDGAHLIPLAFHHPDWELVGVDASARAIEAARSGAEALGLENVRFEHADLAEVRPAPARFDYVIAHGVYSWIDATRRAALRALTREVLAPDGLAYVCFNAQPGWGVRGRVRDVVRELAPDGARGRARALGALLEGSDELWGQLLGHELGRAADAGDAYLTHEYLAPDNHAFWLGEVVEDFARDGLGYAGDALALHAEGWVPPALAENVAALAETATRRAELIDLLMFRQLRGALFAREDAVMGTPADASLLESAHVFGVLRPLSDPFDPGPGVEEPFEGPGGTEVRVGTGLGKMALLALAIGFPDAHAAPALVELATRHLAQRGFGPEPDAAGPLRAGLFELVRHRALELRLERPSLRRAAGPKPRASALARWEARRRAVLSTPIHTALPLDPVDRALLERLDGSRELEEVAEALVDDVIDGRVTLEGAPSGALRVRPLLHERAERLVTTLGWWGLLD